MATSTARAITRPSQTGNDDSEVVQEGSFCVHTMTDAGAGVVTASDNSLREQISMTFSTFVLYTERLFVRPY